jgi:TonB family protein
MILRRLAAAGAALCISSAARAQSAPPAAAADTGRVGNQVYTYVEQQPRFRGGGIDSIFAYLAATVRYPQEALTQRLEGRVFISFVVGTTGAVEEAQVLKGTHPLLDAEALRVIQSMPAWTPGRQLGRPVRVSYTLPITFRLPTAAQRLRLNRS